MMPKFQIRSSNCWLHDQNCAASVVVV